jgi:hypothetical protein
MYDQVSLRLEELDGKFEMRVDAVIELLFVHKGVELRKLRSERRV